MTAQTSAEIPALTSPKRLPAALSLVAGLTDVTSWLTLGGLFAAHITGNLVVISADLVRGEAPGTPQLLAVPMFVVVGAIGYGASHLLGRYRGRASYLLAIQAILLLTAFWIAVRNDASVHARSHGGLSVGMLAVAAMAFQNTMLHLMSGPVPTTAVMTGNLISATLALGAMVGGPRSERSSALTRWRGTWPLLLGFLIGCVLGAAAVLKFSEWAWSLPAAVSLALCYWQARHDFSPGTGAPARIAP
ncbi:YoaK family protein [Variovorax sp. GT1P44]|uniref:YoaK family protein n=1 Tax=Variovorax sp. GT1P44 TaxID=3443742 RepID=UPI003F45F9EB